MREFIKYWYNLDDFGLDECRSAKCFEARVVYTYLCYTMDKNATRTSVADRLGIGYSSVKRRMEFCQRWMRSDGMFKNKIERLKNECIKRELR